MVDWIRKLKAGYNDLYVQLNSPSVFSLDPISGNAMVKYLLLFKYKNRPDFDKSMKRQSFTLSAVIIFGFSFIPCIFLLDILDIVTLSL